MRNPLLYAHAARLLRDFNSLDAEGQRNWRHGRLRQIIAAARRSEYGKRSAAGEFLGDWPVLEKDLIRAAPNAFRTTECWFTVSASTSGATGTPVRLRRSLLSVAYEQALVDQLLANGGVDPLKCRTAALRGDDVKDPADSRPPFWKLASGSKRLTFSFNHLDAASVGHIVATLRKHSPDVVFAYPSVLGSLCSLMLNQGLRLKVPLTVCGSESLTRGTSDIAREALGTRVIGHYGQAERVAWAEGDPENGYRFVPTYSVNELRFLHTADNADVYEVIGTGLWNRAMPLVRYNTGDQIRVRKGSSPTAVAEGRETFLGIIGRSSDYLIAPSGARLLGIDHIPRNVPHIVRAQFIQESTQSVTLLVVPGPGFDEECRRLLLQHASVKLPPSMSIRIETTTQLVRNRSGKAPLIVRNIVNGAP
jgi:phenylacetate-CoA ligase